MLICLCCVVFVGRGGVPSCPPQQQQQQQEAMVANHCVLTKTSHPTFNPSSLSCCCSHPASVPHHLCPPCLANHPHTHHLSLYAHTSPLLPPTNTPITINNALQTVLPIHIDKHLLGIHLLGGQLAAVLAPNLSLQRRLSVDSLAALLPVHRLRSRLVQRRQLALLADVVQQLHRRLRRQALLRITPTPQALRSNRR